MILDQEIDSVVNEIQQLFADAMREKCNCGSDPDGCCDFCSKWGKAQCESKKLIAKLIADASKTKGKKAI